MEKDSKQAHLLGSDTEAKFPTLRAACILTLEAVPKTEKPNRTQEVAGSILKGCSGQVSIKVSIRVSATLMDGV